MNSSARLLALLVCDDKELEQDGLMSPAECSSLHARIVSLWQARMAHDLELMRLLSARRKRFPEDCLVGRVAGAVSPRWASGRSPMTAAYPARGPLRCRRGFAGGRFEASPYGLVTRRPTGWRPLGRRRRRARRGPGGRRGVLYAPDEASDRHLARPRRRAGRIAGVPTRGRPGARSLRAARAEGARRARPAAGPCHRPGGYPRGDRTFRR